MTSLWRKRKHFEQNHDNLSNSIDRLHMMWIDPPEGWKYGFPAIYDPNTDGQLSEWIVKRGYPISLIQEYGDVWSVRCWPVETPKGDIDA